LRPLWATDKTAVTARGARVPRRYALQVFNSRSRNARRGDVPASAIDRKSEKCGTIAFRRDARHHAEGLEGGTPLVPVIPPRA
jgi:hypothetical protein